MTKHSKTLERLLERADRTGSANLNGRPMAPYWGDTQPLQEKWHIDDTGDTLTVRHWGTEILKVTYRGRSTSPYIYGESMTDRDALNQLFDYLGLFMHTHYYPSREAFEVHENGTDKVLEVM